MVSAAAHVRRAQGDVTPPGWHIDEDSGALVRDTIHHMGRRCRNWDYCGKGCYQITIVLANRRSALFGELRFCETRGAYVELSGLNLIASEIAGDGSVEIVYKGYVPSNVEKLARAAVQAEDVMLRRP